MEIVPFMSVGKIRFGMSISEVVDVMGETPRIIKRNPNSEELIHEYSCCFVNFDIEGICYCVEVWSGLELQFKDIDFFKSNYQNVKMQMVKIDPKLFYNGTGFISVKTGIVVYSPVAEEIPDTDIEVVSVFSIYGLNEFLK